MTTIMIRGVLGPLLFLLSQVLVLLFFSAFVLADEGEDGSGEKKKEGSMESTIMCTFDGHPELDVVDWTAFFTVLQQHCSYAEAQFRIVCAPQAVALASWVTAEIASAMREHELNLLCPNGVVQATSIALAHNTTHHLKHRWVLREALQKSYVLDNSKWHVKSVDALELLRDTYRRTEFSAKGVEPVPVVRNQQMVFGDAILGPPVRDRQLIPGGVTILAPFVDAASMQAGAFADILRNEELQAQNGGGVRVLYPGSSLFEESQSSSMAGDEAARSKAAAKERRRSLGDKMNRLSDEVDTEYTLVVASELIPSADDLKRLLHVLDQDDGYLSGVSFSGLTNAEGSLSEQFATSQHLAKKISSPSQRRRILDFCYSLKAKHWILRFSRDYFSYTIPREKMHPKLLPPDTKVSMHDDGAVRYGSSVRSYHEPFLAHELQSCKTCETLAPTFLVRTKVLTDSAPFRVSLDGEWALLDWFLRKSWHEKGEHGFAQCVGGYLHPMHLFVQGSSSSTTSSSYVVSTSSAVELVASREWRHLYGAKEDVGFFFSSRLSADFRHWLSHLLPMGAQQGLDRHVKEFLEKNDLKEIETIDGEERRYGCTLRTPNCPMDWLYKGWAIPPCCRRTLQNLVFFADELFAEHKIKYIVTDGGLLGGLKLGRFLDWDGDVDFHIEDESFDRLESLRPWIEQAGYHLRLHEGGNSYLLQANKFNYLLLELNKRAERFPDDIWMMEIDGRWLPVMDNPGRNVSEWYGEGIYAHRARYIPPWEEDAGNLMFCSNPGHHNCVDDLPHGDDCHLKGPCNREKWVQKLAIST
ncbi:unnamed protein product [Amoebophrya sp. A25]|nr:unnamed protein product [Amoebophrya sp. A25]|eukprot:GSA25T00015826001.1